MAGTHRDCILSIIQFLEGANLHESARKLVFFFQFNFLLLSRTTIAYVHEMINCHSLTYVDLTHILITKTVNVDMWKHDCLCPSGSTFLLVFFLFLIWYKFVPYIYVGWRGNQDCSLTWTTLRTASSGEHFRKRRSMWAVSQPCTTTTAQLVSSTRSGGTSSWRPWISNQLMSLIINLHY